MIFFTLFSQTLFLNYYTTKVLRIVTRYSHDVYAGDSVSELLLRNYFPFYELKNECQKSNYKKFPVFYIKIKNGAYIKNVKHCSLHLDVINN